MSSPVILKIEADTKLQRELGIPERYLRGPEGMKAEGCGLMKRVKRLSAPDAKAVRVHAGGEGGREEYQAGQIFIYRTEDYFLRLDAALPGFCLEYCKPFPGLTHMAKHAARWLVKSIYLRRGFLYVPGFLVRHGVHPFVLLGHPECGLVDALSAAVQAGGQRNSEYGFMLSKHKKKQEPLWFSETGKFENEAWQARKLEKMEVLSEPPALSSLTRFIFTRSWNSRKSSIRKIRSAEAFLWMDAINRRAYEYFLPDQRKKLVCAYPKAFRKTPFFEWNPGTDLMENARGFKAFIRGDRA